MNSECESSSSTRRTFLGQAIGAAAAVAAGSAFAQPASDAGAGARPPQRPNLLFVFSDQQSYDMLGCYGNGQIVTPSIDAFAAQGVRFNQCISNSPLCTPYRGTLMSGQHPLYHGALINDLQMLPGGGRYLGEVLRDAGYRMGYFGKWHLYGGDRNRPIPPGPFRYGFDGEFLSNNCTLTFDAKRAHYWDMDGKKQLYGDWEPYAQARQAMKFVDDHAAAAAAGAAAGANGRQPFALFLSWHPPHNWNGESYEAPEDVKGLYDPAKLQLRPNVKDTPQIRKNVAGHMEMCSSLDKAFGWLMDKLKERGLSEDTIVVYTADHGDMLMSHDWAGHKGRPENEACHVPLIVRWPRRFKPRASDLLVGALDLMPTLLGLAGLKPPETCQGRNLADAIFAGRDDEVESVPLHHVPTNWRGVYTRRYTYAFDLPVAQKAAPSKKKPAPTYNCLYDREADPSELKNLFADDDHKALREHLHEQTAEWMKRFRDTGVLFQNILPRVLVPEDLPSGGGKAGMQSGQGRLKGRPIDLI